VSGLFGYSADCMADDCEHCEQPDGCDCPCHLDLPPWDDEVDDDAYGWSELADPGPTILTAHTILDAPALP
jgi:hypothetical protein